MDNYEITERVLVNGETFVSVAKELNCSPVTIRKKVHRFCENANAELYDSLKHVNNYQGAAIGVIEPPYLDKLKNHAKAFLNAHAERREMEDKKRIKSCSTCKFWKCTHDHHAGCHESDRIGVCRRYPPVFDSVAASESLKDEDMIYIYNENGTAWNQPTVYAHDWCGEYCSA